MPTSEMIVRDFELELPFFTKNQIAQVATISLSNVFSQYEKAL